MSRPREFDRQAALQTAMQLFWQRGYEGVSVASLTAAMKISPPSFYAAFKSKADLYREALKNYQNRPRAVSSRFLAESIPVDKAIRQLFRAAIQTGTELSPSPGCMISNGLLAVGPDHGELAELTASLRRDLVAALKARIEQGVKSGELVAGTRPAALARYLAAIVQGISVQAHDGASKAELEGIVASALDAFSSKVSTLPYQSVRNKQAATDLSRQSARARLAPRREPYWQRLAKGCALGFRRGPDTWIARYTKRDGSKIYQSLDDAADHQEAKQAAERWLATLGRSPLRTTGRKGARGHGQSRT